MKGCNAAHEVVVVNHDSEDDYCLIDPTVEIFLDNVLPFDEVRVFQRTSYEWAKQNPEETLWMQPLCKFVDISDMQYAIGSIPFDTCPECGHGAVPYRENK